MSVVFSCWSRPCRLLASWTWIIARAGSFLWKDLVHCIGYCFDFRERLKTFNPWGCSLLAERDIFELSRETEMVLPGSRSHICSELALSMVSRRSRQLNRADPLRAGLCNNDESHVSNIKVRSCSYKQDQSLNQTTEDTYRRAKSSYLQHLSHDNRYIFEINHHGNFEVCSSSSKYSIDQTEARKR